MILVRRISLIFVQIKTPKHEEIKFIGIKRTMPDLQPGKPMRLCTQNAKKKKKKMFGNVMKSYAPFSKRQS